MSQLLLSVPDTTASILQVPEEQVGEALLMAAAVKFYEAGRLSAGAAADLAGISKPAFVTALASYNVPVFRQSLEELTQEFANA